MRIVFYAGHFKWGQLGNNGGTKTMLLSAMMLKNLGHKVRIVAKKDHHTWIKHPKIRHKVSRKAQIVIACSVSDIAPMLKQAPKKAKKIYWMRAFETWQMNKVKIYNRLRKFSKKHLILCNSTWLVNNLVKQKIPSKLCYAGFDVEEWHDMNLRRHDKVAIGCLYSSTHKTKRWDLFLKLIKKLGREHYKYYSYGNNKVKVKGLEHHKRPSHQRLVEIYSKCHIWFSPTELEGMHSPPAEAALCGCLVYCNNKESNGLGDYCNDETAMIFKNLDDAVKLIKKPDYSKVQKMQMLLVNKVGDRERNMKRMVELMKG